MRTEKQLANLKKFSSSEARKNGKKGAKASAEARAIKKTIRQAVLDMVDTDSIAQVLLKAANDGNLKAIDMVVDLMGEKVIKQEISMQTTDKTIEAMEAYFNDDGK